MGRVLKYAGEFRKYTKWALFLVFVSVIFSIVPYYLMNRLIVGFISGGTPNLNYVLILCAGSGIALLLKAVTNGWGLGLSHVGAFGTLHNMRVRFAMDVTNQPMGDITETGTGAYKKGFVEDVNTLELIIAHLIPEGLPNLFIVLTVYVLIFIADFRMGFLTLATLPIGIIPSIIMFRAGLRMMPMYYEVKDKLSAAIVEYVYGMEVVKVFGNTVASFRKFSKAVENNRDYTMEWFTKSWKISSVIFAGMPCTVLLTLPVGTHMYLSGTLALETLILVLMLNLSISVPIIKLVKFSTLIPNVGFAVTKLEKVFRRDNVCSGIRTQLPSSLEVRFNNVSFAYGERDVITDLSLTLKPDTLTALVGESGSGKSTLAKLLVHFWDARDGQISIGGVDIREFTSETLMSMVSYVAQDTLLFSGTIAENIAMGSPAATREDIVEAARAAACHDFITRLERGYDTDVGSLGDKLSGGEKQRVTIARAIIKDAPILILDEATAFADAENEDLIQEALGRLLADKTAVVIAHRLNTIVHADNIVVLDDGRIESEGTHDKLLQGSELYRRLWARNEQATRWNIEV